jgi:aldehyde dehydrogenase (NAD+)
MSLTQKIETPSITYEQPTGLYIDGKWVKGKEGKTFETINPTNEKPIVAVQEAGPEGKSTFCDYLRFSD